jgi:hypothetical protein
VKKRAIIGKTLTGTKGRWNETEIALIRTQSISIKIEATKFTYFYTSFKEPRSKFKNPYPIFMLLKTLYGLTYNVLRSL